jgi:hypothetical protein
MKALVSLGDTPDIVFRVTYSVDRIGQSTERWTGHRNVPKDVLRRCRYWTSEITTAQCKETMQKLLRPVYDATLRPALTIAVYPVPGPPARVGGQAFPEESSIEVWCAQLGPADIPTFAGTIAHESAHLMLMPLVREAMAIMEHPADTATLVCEVLCRAYTGFPPCSEQDSGAELVLATAASLLTRTVHPGRTTVSNAVVGHVLRSLRLAEIRLMHRKEKPCTRLSAMT